MKTLLPAILLAVSASVWAADPPRTGTQTSQREMEREFRQELKAIDDQIEQLNEDLEDRVEKLREKREAIAERIQESREKEGVDWESVKGKFREEMKELRDEYDDLKRKVTD